VKGWIFLTDEEKELIVKLVANGKNTFKELRNVAPDEWRWSVFGYIGKGGRPDDVVQMDKVIDFFEVSKCKPVDSDTFHLTDAGKNLLHRLNKESDKIQLAEKAVTLAEESLKKSEVSNKLAIDSNDVATRAAETSQKSMWIALFALIVAVIALVKSCF